MGPGFSRDAGCCCRRKRSEPTPLRWIRSWCCSMLLSVKSVSSLLPEAKQSIPRWEGECHCTTCDITLHISLHNNRYQNTHLALQKDSLRIRMSRYSVIYLIGAIVWRDQ